MRKNYIIVSAMTIAGALIMMSSSGGRNDDRTGAPSSNGNCSSCHTGGIQGTSVNIGVTEKGAFTPLTSYQAGKTYTVTIAVLGASSSKGFQSTVLDASNIKTGTTANPTSGSRIISANSRDIVVQSSPSLTGAWSFEWTAPASPTGSVTIYAAGVAANGTGSDNGDQGAVATKSLTLDAGAKTATNNLVSMQVYPNPCSDVLQLSKAADQITITGITGAAFPADISGTNINTLNLPQGFYYLKWTKGNETGTIKFQKN
ncbi:MAG: T9SS C-terminal target domain-containing protein [Bacteroidetes bacterium]|nr:T9SS C-terminal target domain-containing protein [Bacteroidota bacterium]